MLRGLRKSSEGRRLRFLIEYDAAGFPLAQAFMPGLEWGNTIFEAPFMAFANAFSQAAG